MTPCPRKGKFNENITADELRSVLDYNPDTGVFTCLTGRGRQRVGAIAGYINPLGYRAISINKTRYLASRLAFLYVYGRWPDHFVDHIDMSRSNDRIANLREATQSQNQANRHVLFRNKSGFKGVSLIRKTGRWRAAIKVRGRARHIGEFHTAEEAGEAYRKAAIAEFGEFARFSHGDV